MEDIDDNSSAFHIYSTTVNANKLVMKSNHKTGPFKNLKATNNNSNEAIENFVGSDDDEI